MLVKQDKKITEIMHSKEFTFSAEFVPPRNGEPIANLFKKVAILKEANIDFLSITKGAGGSLRGGTIPIAFLIKEKYKIPVIAHFTCMESSLQELENSLIDQAYLGITNILALRGDPPTGIFATYTAKENQHQFAYQLIGQMKDLVAGKYILRSGFDSGETTYHEGQPLSFCIGAAAYPEPVDGDFAKSIDYFSLKVKEGAEYGITQMIYSVESYSKFIAKLKEIDSYIPILPGVRVLTSIKQAEFLIKNFKINIPEKYLEIIKSEDLAANKEYIKNLIVEFRAAGAKGIQFFIMNEAELVGQIVKEMNLLFKN